LLKRLKCVLTKCLIKRTRFIRLRTETTAIIHTFYKTQNISLSAGRQSCRKKKKKDFASWSLFSLCVVPIVKRECVVVVKDRLAERQIHSVGKAYIKPSLFPRILYFFQRLFISNSRKTPYSESRQQFLHW
jgi:hypothetical protein